MPSTSSVQSTSLPFVNSPRASEPKTTKLVSGRTRVLQALESRQFLLRARRVAAKNGHSAFNAAASSSAEQISKVSILEVRSQSP